MASDIYRGYEAWKGWDAQSFMTLQPVDRAYFDREIGAVPLAGARVLDIGFGNGTLLAWCREKGAELYGTEISDQGVALARGHGVTVLPSSLDEIDRSLDAGFALITAFDVLEHMSPVDMGRLFDQVARLLRPGGLFVARFPNGQSPFGRVNQASDYTHVTTVSAPMIKQIVAGKPFVLAAVGEDLQDVCGTAVQRLKQRIQIRVRQTAAAAIKRIFRFDAPFGVNVTVTLRRLAS